ncbi:MAG TPA: hypothetical protein DDY18_09675 [Flavobacterium sp.]|jgi:hypothetical protein|nr:hypothetical protein [Flavobacterium sp.]
MDLKSVSVFSVVQADGPETEKTTITDEKDFNSLEAAIDVLKISEAPIKYLKFNYDGSTYKMYPIEDSEEYTVTKTPILN